MFKLETEKPGRGRNSLSEFSSRTREIELEHEAKRLRQVEKRVSLIYHTAVLPDVLFQH